MADLFPPWLSSCLIQIVLACIAFALMALIFIDWVYAAKRAYIRDTRDITTPRGFEYFARKAFQLLGIVIGAFLFIILFRAIVPFFGVLLQSQRHVGLEFWKNEIHYAIWMAISAGVLMTIYWPYFEKTK